LQTTRGRVKSAVLGCVDSIETRRHFAALVLGDKIGQRGGVQPTPGDAQALSKGFSGFKQLVWNGQRNLHTLVLPRYEKWGKLPNLRLHPSTAAAVELIRNVRRGRRG
jgi:hypothetical protein